MAKGTRVIMPTSRYVVQRAGRKNISGPETAPGRKTRLRRRGPPARRSPRPGVTSQAWQRIGVPPFITVMSLSTVMMSSGEPSGAPASSA